MIPVNVKAIKDLQDEIESNERRVKRLQEQIETSHARIAAIQIMQSHMLTATESRVEEN